MAPLVATYRLQFHHGFTLRDALSIVPYLAELGVSHIYASPLLVARSGSLHGYDVCDPSRINPELGSEADLARLVEALRGRNMGLVLDIVPNHMSAGPENPWWWDVLKHGRASQFAKFFDIDWDTPVGGVTNKVILPILGDEIQRILQRHELKLATAKGELVLQYFEQRLPLSGEFADQLKRSNQSCLSDLDSDPNVLCRLLDQQHYQLAFWRSGDQMLNYRRFFNIVELAGMRVEDGEVFAATHSRVLQWSREGVVDGLRIDHPDGLYDPQSYLERLRHHSPHTWLIVEKILCEGESLPTHWPIQGTVGYDFLNRLNGLFIDPTSEPALTAFYREFTGEQRVFEAMALEKKRLVLQSLFAAELRRLEHLLVRILANEKAPLPNERTQLQDALVELAACFPVYRTYAQAQAGQLSKMDAQYITVASARARQNRTDLAAILDFIRDVLLLRRRPAGSVPFVMLFQQLTGPAMAKGVEDTAFYCFNRFVALNEVGGNPGVFGASLQAFHDSCRDALRAWPLSMLASSTHDTKRSEDVRARLALVSEIPAQWTAAVERWSGWLKKYRQTEQPDRNAEYLFYQTAVGAWPLSPERALAYMQKATREAKEHTSWSDPNPDYEKALQHFVMGALGDGEFVKDLEHFVAELIAPAQINSLAQTLIKLTVPGVPDIYQGTELWDLSLVDPDNRRPVDFGLRRKALESLRGLSAEAVWQGRAQGLPKLWLIWRTLLFRMQRPELFGAKASYQPLIAEGEHAQRVMSFLRAEQVVTVAPRLVMGLRNGWSNTSLHLPVGLWRNELTSEIIRGGDVGLATLLSAFPVALLSQIRD